MSFFLVINKSESCVVSLNTKSQSSGHKQILLIVKLLQLPERRLW